MLKFFVEIRWCALPKPTWSLGGKFTTIWSNRSPFSVKLRLYPSIFLIQKMTGNAVPFKTFYLRQERSQKIRFSCFQRHGLDKLLGSHGYFNLLAPTNAALGRSQLGSRKVRIPYTDSETTTVYSSGRLVPVLKRCVPHRVSINRG